MFGYGELGYLDLLRYILKNGTDSGDRTGVGTRKIFGAMLKFTLQNGFPLLTTKDVRFQAILGELLWMISGETNIRPLVLKGINIWNDWPLRNYLQNHGIYSSNNPIDNLAGWKEHMKIFRLRIKEDPDFAKNWGELGPVYGYQWRKWQTSDGREIDQLQNAIDMIRKSPDSRRIIVMAWNPADIDEMAISGLPPCHYGYQFQVADGQLNCLMTQRSVDCFLGLPYNIASYALLTHMVAKLCGLEPGELTLSLADTHIYLNHINAVKEQLQRNPRKLPSINIRDGVSTIDEFTEADFELIGYNPHPPIRAEIAV